jgi:hypothetical protein
MRISIAFVAAFQMRDQRKACPLGPAVVETESGFWLRIENRHDANLDRLRHYGLVKDEVFANQEIIEKFEPFIPSLIVETGHRSSEAEAGHLRLLRHDRTSCAGIADSLDTTRHSASHILALTPFEPWKSEPDCTCLPKSVSLQMYYA